MNDYYDGAGLALFGVFFFILTIFALAAYVLGSWFLMKIFDKAGVQGRWRAWVPVYNLTVFSKLGDLSPWLVLYGIGLSFVLGFIGLGWLGSLAVFAVTLLAAWRVGLKLQKEAVWIILYFFLPLVWLGILGFDRSRWNTAVQPAPWAGNSFLRDGTSWSGIPVQSGSYAGGPLAPQGYGAPGAYPPPPPGSQPPAGYAAPPAGYTPPPAYTQPPADYGQPPAGYTPPPAGYTPPPAPPAASAPEPPTAPQPPVAPQPPAAPQAPIAPEPPAPAAPPAFPAPPVEPPPPVTPEPGPPVAPEPAPPVTPEPEPPVAPEPPVKPDTEGPKTV